MAYKKLVALDFDGVLHSYSSPWTDAATISDGPTPGAMAFLRDLSDDDRFKIVIVSSRLSEYAGLQAVKRWIEYHAREAFGAEIADGFVPFLEFSKTRPPAHLTIDDRAMQFTGVWPDLDAIAAFKPWNKRKAVGAVDDGDAALAGLIRTRLLGVRPEMQDLVLEDDDWRRNLRVLEGDGRDRKDTATSFRTGQGEAA